MKRRTRLTALLVTLLLGSGLAATSTIRQQRTFRAATDVVIVPVSVRDGGDQVRGLTADDFILLDNGTKQRIEQVDAETVPIDVSLIVDASGGRFGLWQTMRPPAELAKDVWADVRQIAATLRPDDRLRLVAYDTYANEVLPLQAASMPIVEQPFPANGRAALHDAITSSLIRPVDVSRRHVIIARTKAFDTMSVANATTVRDVARRSDALLHIIYLWSEAIKEQMLHQFQATYMSLSNPTKQFWRPYNREELSTLEEAANATGGIMYGQGFIGDRDLAGTFKSIFEEFRQGYVLRYTRQGASRDGWHEIKVTVRDKPKYVVRARRGYAIEAPPPSVPSPPARPSSDPPTVTLDSLARAFERADYNTVITSLRLSPDVASIVDAFLAGDSPWATQPKRDAVFALDLANAAMFSGNAKARDAGERVLTQYVGLVRQPLGPDDFECLWYQGAMGLMVGARSVGAVAAATKMVARCPNSPQLFLALAIATDQKWPIGMARTPSWQRIRILPTDDHVASVTARYEAAMRFPETAASARVRAAWFEYRLGHLDRALALVDGVGEPPPDRELQYLHQLIRGQILRALEQPGPAAIALGRALEIYPRAQSARVSLMTLLLERGQRDEAAAVAELIETAPSDDFDPWWRYWQDGRQYPLAAVRLRAMIQ